MYKILELDGKLDGSLYQIYDLEVSLYQILELAGYLYLIQAGWFPVPDI